MNLFLYAFKPFQEPCLSSCLLDGPRNSGCAHICALEIKFYEIGKDEERRCQTIRVDFVLFYQKIKDKNQDNKLLEML